MPRPALLLLLLLLTMLIAPTASAAEGGTPLTLERLYADPALSGTPLRGLKLSPDGRYASFLRGRDEDQNQQDLWAYDVKTGKTARLVDSTALVAEETLSDEEKARRERLRITSLRGIVEYFWDAKAERLLFPLGGALYLYELESGESRQLTRAEDGFATDPKFSPRGGYVSYVRAQNLEVIRLSDGQRLPITTKGGGTVSYGMAEFVAQEEMSRLTGYWWAPDDSGLLYTRIDETPVPIERRFEIYADRTEVIEQRYPAAGKNNVLIELHEYRFEGETHTPVPLGAETDIYIARAGYTRDGAVWFQRQSRNQRTLDLIRWDRASGTATTLLTETAPDWVNLHDDLRFLRDGRFLWSSERDGYRQLELRAADGKLLHTITRGSGWQVDAVLAVDERRGQVYFAANRDAVVEKQLYRAALDGSDADQLTRISQRAGWHEASFAGDASVYLETWSDQLTPPQVRLRRADGRELTVLDANAVVEGHPYFPHAAAHIKAEFGTLSGPDGSTLHWRMLKPRGYREGQRYPVFLRTYGGPHVQVVQNSWDGRWGLFDQLMAQRGFIVFSLDNRGSDRRGKAFESALYGRMGGPEVEDQLAGIRWLRERADVDPARIGVFGWSYGGYMVLHLLARGSEVIKGGVSVAPVTDWALYDTHYTERYMDHPAANPEGYRQASIFPHLDGLTSDLYLIHGMADDNVLFTHSTALMSALQERGTRFRLMTYPGGKHGINATTAQRRHVFAEVLGYFESVIR